MSILRNAVTRRGVITAAALAFALLTAGPAARGVRVRAGDTPPSNGGVATKGAIQGGEGGDAFTDEPAGRLATISIRAGGWVDAIGCEWEAGGKTTKTSRHGGMGGTEEVIHLDPGERLTRVSGVFNPPGWIGSITLVTSRGREWGPFGQTLTGRTFECVAGPGEEICGFRGRSGTYLNALGFLVRHATADASTTTAEPARRESAPEPEWLRARVQEIATRAGLPSLAASLFVDGKVVAVSAVGVRKLGAPDRVRTNDAYLLGSVTKPITATLVGRCVDRGILRFDTTLAEMFPELKATMRAEARKVTVAQLLSHTSGLPYQPSTPQEAIDLRGADPVARRYEYVKAALADPLVSSPGTTVTYGGGPIIVVAALERSTKRSYEELMRDEVFVPLGMTTAGFGDMASPGRIDGVWGHAASAGKVVPVSPKPGEATYTRLPVGGVHASVGDLVRWAAAFVGPPAGAKPFLRAQTLHALSTEVSEGTGSAPGWFTARVAWAKGVVLWHNGSQGRNFALVHVMPEDGWATCVATNVAGLPDGRVDAACQELHLFLAEQVRSMRKAK